MKEEQNELLTRIGPGTPCGNLLRQYWQPVALLDEFDPLLESRMAERPMKAVRLMGQDLVPLSKAILPGLANSSVCKDCTSGPEKCKPDCSLSKGMGRCCAWEVRTRPKKANNPQSKVLQTAKRMVGAQLLAGLETLAASTTKVWRNSPI